MESRASGLLLHLTSLPTPFGIGDLGPEAYAFADFLAASRQRYWQILPLNPTSAVHNHSPYSSFSSFAGNPLLVSPQRLLNQGYIEEVHLKGITPAAEGLVRFGTASVLKQQMLHRAFRRHQETGFDQPAFEQFCNRHAHWLDDFALFVVLKSRFKHRSWSDWPEDLKYRRPEALSSWKEQLAEEIEEQKFFQFIFFEQWFALKSHCNRMGIYIIGDIPIYVDYDSVDVWTEPHLFKLNEAMRPAYVAGVPPDYFSKTGQRWGNPVYDWPALQQTGYSWWLRRLRHNFELFDVVRIDHFRGFVAYWEIPAAEQTAINGRWTTVPAVDFFDTVREQFASLPIIVEDLGFITDDVREIMRRYDLPGMKVLLFAFEQDDPLHPYLPHNFTRNCVVYTGTHDTNTCRGWFENDASEKAKQHVLRYIGRRVSGEEISWELVRLAFLSVADLSVVPVQDLLALGADARMNRPATRTGNWLWQLRAGDADLCLARKLAALTHTYARAQ